MNKENTNTQQVNHHLVFVSLLNWFSNKNEGWLATAGRDEQNWRWGGEEGVQDGRKGQDRQTNKNGNMLWQENSSRKKYHRQIIGGYSEPWILYFNLFVFFTSITTTGSIKQNSHPRCGRGEVRSDDRNIWEEWECFENKSRLQPKRFHHRWR